MAAYLLDTNHLSQAIRPVSRVREQIHQAHRTGIRVGTCVPVLCELEAALETSVRRASHRRTLDHLLTRVRIWPIDRSLARVYGELYQDLRARGRALSRVDMIVAPLARMMDPTVLTTDLDFQALPDVRIENWIR
jgi:tRNA(fMet)-specific endonuclease VapC